MGFFDVEDGEGGSVEDRIAILAVVAFAFCWIPIFLIWKCISVMRRNHGNEKGDMPVPTQNSDPEKHPYRLETQTEDLLVPSARGSHREAPESRNVGGRASTDVERRSSRGDLCHKTAGAHSQTSNSRHEFDSAETAHSTHANHEHLSSSRQTREVAHGPAPSRRQSGHHHNERNNTQQQVFHNVRL